MASASKVGPEEDVIADPIAWETNSKQLTASDGSKNALGSPSTFLASEAYRVYLPASEVADSRIPAIAATDVEATTSPVAKPGGPYKGTVSQSIPFNGAGSTAPKGQTLTYAWNFGDGQTGTGVSPTHIYLAAGTYTVSLVVKDSSGISSVAAKTTATVLVAPIASPGGPYTGSVGQSITFNGSGSSAPKGLTLTYAWSFGDGKTGSGEKPAHTYTASGSFTVSLVVTDSQGAKSVPATTSSTIANVVVANPGGPYAGNVSQSITFNGSGSTGPKGLTLTYAWAFGDGKTGSGVKPTHAYTAAGTYKVSLVVTDSKGAKSAAATTTATVAGAPVAKPGGPYTGTVGQTIIFNGSGSSGPAGQILTYSWSFGDSTSGTGVSPIHSYTKAGTFTVSLKVTDTSGVSSTTVTTKATISVQTPPTVTGFTPASGPIGTVIAVKGTNLAPAGGAAPVVTLGRQGGGVQTAPVSAFTATTLSFVIPAGAATGPLTVMVGSESAKSSGTLTITTSSSFTVAATPSTGKLIQGQSTALSVTIGSSNGFTGLATLSVTGLPSGVTAAFKPSSISVGQVSVLTLTAPANQAASTSALTITGSAAIQGQSVTQTASASVQVVPITTSFLGRTVVDDAQQEPIAGVTVSFMGKDDKGNPTGCAGTTTSDGGGNFSLTSLPTACIGPQLISYNGMTATAPPGKYAGVNLSYTLVSGQVVASPVLIHLPRIDNAEVVEVQQNAPNDQVFYFQTIPGLKVTVYAGTTLTLDDGSQPNPFPLIGIEIPLDRLPDAIPTTGMLTPFIVAFQPANAVSSQPVAVNFPNPIGTPPGAHVTFVTLDPTHGYMVPYGTGTVSSDGTEYVADADPSHPGHGYGLVHFDWHGPMPGPPPAVNPSPEDSPPPDCGCSGSGSPNPPPAQVANPVDLSSGIVNYSATDLQISGGRGSIAINRYYRTLDSNVGPFGIVECPATFVPASVRETGMRGALNGTRKEAYGGADCEFASAG